MTEQAHLPIRTAEHVRLAYPLAGIGNRFLAAFLDGLVIALGIVGLTLLFLTITERLHLRGLPQAALGGVFLVVETLLLPFAYYVLLETFWNGQTVGKRVVGVRVIREDGSPVGFFQVAARNLARVIDILPPALAADIAVMMLSRKGQRLGDLVAGTVVVKSRFERDFQRLRTEAGDEVSRLTVRGLSGEAQRLVREFALREVTLSPSARAAVARSVAQSVRPLVPESADYADDVAFLRAVAAGLRAQADEASR